MRLMRPRQQSEYAAKLLSGNAIEAAAEKRGRCPLATIELERSVALKKATVCATSEDICNCSIAHLNLFRQIRLR